MSDEVDRQVILVSLRPIVNDGLKYMLRKLPPPGGGWLVHVKESDLQELSDQKREDLLIRTMQAVERLKEHVAVGIIRTLE